MVSAESMLVAQSIKVYARLSLQFVVMPDPLTTCVWVVDLRDIGHPVPYPYPDRTAAEVARRCFIRDAITEEVDSLTQSA
jgi:hypothetical protein